MQLGPSTAAVDNDFIDHIIHTRRSQAEIIKNVHIVFDELNLKGVVHPLVYVNEINKDDVFVCKLFEEQILNQVDFDDIFQNDDSKRHYYFYLVSEFFRSLKGEALPVSGEDLLSYWKKRSNLGEVHSIAMCLICKCGIFLSDDKDSKKIERHIKQRGLGKICVYNRQDFFEKHNQEGSTNIPRVQRKALSHVR